MKNLAFLLHVLHILQKKDYLIVENRNPLLRHKAGQEGRGEILLENSFMR